MFIVYLINTKRTFDCRIFLLFCIWRYFSAYKGGRGLGMNGSTRFEFTDPDPDPDPTRHDTTRPNPTALRRLRISQMRTDSCGPTFADDISGRQMRTTLADDRCGRQTRTDKYGRQMRTDFCGPNSYFLLIQN